MNYYFILNLQKKSNLTIILNLKKLTTILLLTLVTLIPKIAKEIKKRKDIIKSKFLFKE